MIRGNEMSKMVNVRIMGEQIIRYDQIVKMDIKDYLRLNTALEAEDAFVGEAIQDFLDVHDVDSWEDLEVDTFEIVG